MIPLWIPLALTAASAVANNVASNKVAGAQAQVMQTNRERQKRLDDEAFGINDQMRDRYNNIDDQQATVSSDLADYYGRMSADNPTPAAAMLPASDSNIVNSRQDAEMDTAKNFVAGQAERLGALRSFGDLFGGISREQGRSAGDVNMLYGFKRGFDNVTPLELEAASRAGDRGFLLGDILGGLGSIMMFPALSAGGAAAAAGGAAAASTPAITGPLSQPVSFANNSIPALY